MDVAASAKTCPHCGVANPASAGANAAGAVLSVILIGALAWFFFGGGLDQQAAKGMDDIYAKVAQDAVDQYNIAARSGTAMDRCVHAGMVAAAYIQAKDNSSYAAWKQTEKVDCKAAGVPR